MSIQDKKIKELGPRTVELVAINPMYRNVPFFAVPVYNEEKRSYDLCGQEKMTPAEKEKQPIAFEVNESYPLMHRDKCDLNFEKDKLMYAFWLTQKDVVARTKKEAKKGVHLFYIEDKELEAKETISKTEKIFEALKYVTEKITTSDYENYALLLGMNVKGATMSMLGGALKQRALDNPEQVISVFQGDNEHKLFALKLLSKGILSRKSDGRIYDKDNLIGRDVDDVVIYIRDEKNAMVVDIWAKKLI